MDIYDDKGLTPDFRGLLKANVVPEQVPQVYVDLHSIGTSFVTTNYDEWLDVLAERPLPTPQNLTLDTPNTDRNTMRTPPHTSVTFGLEQLTIEKLALPGNVVHLHGSVRAPRSMVMTSRQYLDHYRQPLVTDFLDELFGRYTVLFVGYGLEEDEILEYVLRKRSPNTERRHCRLFPSFAHQQQLTSHLTFYSLNHCSTRLVQYSIDRKGHAQLGEVVSLWATQLRPRVQGQLYLERVKLIDRALEA
jgi:hypothetical protein